MASDVNVTGNGNHDIAGGDINNYNIDSAKIFFNEEDLKCVIDRLDSIDFEEEVDDNDLERIDIEEKNIINNLSQSYFEYMNNEFLPFFWRVEKFLKNSLYAKYKKKYNSVAKRINFYYHSQKAFFPQFEILFAKIMELIEKKYPNNSDTFLIVIHYMYWHCDIGDKK